MTYRLPLMITAAALFVMPMTTAAEEPAPLDQFDLMEKMKLDPKEAFLFTFDAGDELTEAQFTSARGVGAHVTKGQRFTRYPRADLAGKGEWASHLPKREGGPQAQSCITCHAVPYANGAGGLALNVAIDPLQSGDPEIYLERNTLHLFALGAVQRIAEEMSTDLASQAKAAEDRACAAGEPVTIALTAKDVSFGHFTATPVGTGAKCTATRDTSALDGVDDDLVIKMFGWKGTHATIRDFSRGAAHNELGMQGDELVGKRDGDNDGVTAELSVGDMTAIAIYIAALERPTSKLELARHGLMDLSAEEKARIETGETRFSDIGCAACHKPELMLENPVFSEPSTVPGFYDAVFPSGENPKVAGLSLTEPMTFDLTKDQPNNHVTTPDGKALNLGAFERDDTGRAIVRWYSDFKRHDMGPDLADPVDAYRFGASVWPTRSLAGVGSTGPWLHHGHATTLHEAIMAHGGDSAKSRDNYLALTAPEREQVIAFLENLIIIDLDPEEEDH